jgi:hypothetical protein
MVQEHYSWSPQVYQYSTFGAGWCPGDNVTALESMPDSSIGMAFGAGWCKSTAAGVHRLIDIRPLVLDGVRVLMLQP